jgi:hypothetical protein
MRGLFLSFSHRSPILLVGLLLLSTHLLWAQRTSSLEKIPIQLLATPAPFARVSEAQTRLHLTSRGSLLTFEKNRDQTESRMRFFPHYPDYRLPTNATLYPAARTVGSAPSKWLMFAPTYGNVPHEMTYRVENMEDLGHHLPWIGSIILRIGQQAKAHPHVARILTVIKPRL